MTTPIPHIKIRGDSVVTQYPQIEEFTNTQLSIFWTAEEPKVEKDVQDILVNLTEQEKHAVLTTLKLFTLYELKAGEAYWGKRFVNSFPLPEFQTMGHTFSMMELAVHKPFYKKINELLSLDTDDFYNSYLDDLDLKDRMDFVDNVVDNEDDLLSIAGFSFVEGVVLYSSFAFLKHFQSQGKNKILNIVRGINFSVKDENLHAEAGTYVFKLLKSQSKLTPKEEESLRDNIISCAEKVLEHESIIIEKMFDKGKISGVTDKQLVNFVKSRINMCLSNLGYEKRYEVKYNPIADWFYDGINGFKFNDNFVGMSGQYHRNWSESDFVWRDNKYDE